MPRTRNGSWRTHRHGQPRFAPRLSVSLSIFLCTARTHSRKRAKTSMSLLPAPPDLFVDRLCPETPCSTSRGSTRPVVGNGVGRTRPKAPKGRVRKQTRRRKNVANAFHRFGAVSSPNLPDALCSAPAASRPKRPSDVLEQFAAWVCAIRDLQTPTRRISHLTANEGRRPRSHLRCLRPRPPVLGALANRVEICTPRSLPCTVLFRGVAKRWPDAPKSGGSLVRRSAQMWAPKLLKRKTMHYYGAGHPLSPCHAAGGICRFARRGSHIRCFKGGLAGMETFLSVSSPPAQPLSIDTVAV